MLRVVRAAVPILILATALVPIGADPSARAQATDVKSVIETYKQAIVKGDAATVIGLFADDVVVSDLGMTAKGKTEAIAELQQAFAQNPNFSLSFSDTDYVLDTAIERFAFVSDPVRSLGISRVWAIETIVVQNGKIVSYTAVFDTSDAETARFLQLVSGQ